MSDNEKSCERCSKVERIIDRLTGEVDGITFGDCITQLRLLVTEPEPSAFEKWWAKEGDGVMDAEGSPCEVCLIAARAGYSAGHKQRGVDDEHEIGYVSQKCTHGESWRLESSLRAAIRKNDEGKSDD